MAAEDPERADHVGFALRLAYQQASANLAEAIGGWGVTPVQFQTLLQLRQEGRVTQNRLGRSIGMPPANIHRIVRALLAAGYVAVSPRSGDKRVTLVELTEQGRLTLGEMLPAADAANARTLAALGPTDRAPMMDNLWKLADRPRETAFSRAGGQPRPGRTTTH